MLFLFHSAWQYVRVRWFLAHLLVLPQQISNERHICDAVEFLTCTRKHNVLSNCWKTEEKFSKNSSEAKNQEDCLLVNTNVSNAGFTFLNKINFANVCQEVKTFFGRSVWPDVLECSALELQRSTASLVLITLRLIFIFIPDICNIFLISQHDRVSTNQNNSSRSLKRHSD